MERDGAWTKLSVFNLNLLHRALVDPDLSMIVMAPTQRQPWQPNFWARTLFDRRSWLGYPRFGPLIAPHLLRLPVTAPIAVIDTEDYPYINRADLFLLSRCRLYFKRELPPDRWRLLTKTAHRELPTRRFRLRSRLRPLLNKIRPISLGLHETVRRLPQIESEKTTDIFFSGSIEGASTVRVAGIPELVALRERGLKVDIPEQILPPQEFYRRCAKSWIVWSPEGLGWDCYRHYEALGCGSVPLINQPTILRHAPLLDGVHALYYNPEPGFLTAVVEAALADKNRLRTIARDGKAHVLKHHTRNALATYVIESMLATATNIQEM